MTSITFNPRQPRETVPKKDIALVTQISVNRILTYWKRKKTMGRNVQDLIEQTLHFPLYPNKNKMQIRLVRDYKKS
jgi:hypothetical protein